MILDIIEVGVPLITSGLLIRIFPRIVGLTKTEQKDNTNTNSSSGSPYRNQGEVVGEPEIDSNPNIDDKGRLRWRGHSKFLCQACGGTSCKNIKFCHVDLYTCSQKGNHMHAQCKSCGLIATYGMMYEEAIYRK